MKTFFHTFFLAVLACGCATNDDSATGRPDSGSQNVMGSAGSVTAADTRFATEACQTGVTEVEISKLAAQNTTNPRVRALAKELEQDHARAERQLGKLFARKGIPPEKELAPHYQSSLERLAGLRGAEFDRAFKQQIIQDHKKAIEIFERQVNQGSDPELKAFAKDRLPYLREHLAMAERLETGDDTQAEAFPGSRAPSLAHPSTRGLNVPR